MKDVIVVRNLEDLKKLIDREMQVDCTNDECENCNADCNHTTREGFTQPANTTANDDITTICTKLFTTYPDTMSYDSIKALVLSNIKKTEQVLIDLKNKQQENKIVRNSIITMIKERDISNHGFDKIAECINVYTINN